MDDADEVERVAGEFLERHGPRVILDLRERAEIAAANKDQLGAGVDGYCKCGGAPLMGALLMPAARRHRMPCFRARKCPASGPHRGRACQRRGSGRGRCGRSGFLFAQPFECAVHMNQSDSEMLAQLLLRHR